MTVHQKPLRAARYVALDWMLEQARKGEHESAGPNRSPLIDKINRFAKVPPGSPYCASAIKYAFHIAGIDDFGGLRGASVEYMDRWAAEHGYTVTRPFRGDAAGWKIDGDNWADHAIMVRRVLSLGLYFVLLTVEANTSSGEAGSQSEGGGWYLRQRVIRRGRVTFVRDTRKAKRDPYAKAKR